MVEIRELDERIEKVKEQLEAVASTVPLAERLSLPRDREGGRKRPGLKRTNEIVETFPPTNARDAKDELGRTDTGKSR